MKHSTEHVQMLMIIIRQLSNITNLPIFNLQSRIISFSVIYYHDDSVQTQYAMKTVTYNAASLHEFENFYQYFKFLNLCLVYCAVFD